MDLSSEISQIIGQEEGLKLEYKSILPHSRIIAQLISAFANAEGGYIVLGVLEDPRGRIFVVGLSEDFHATDITHRAVDLLKPHPNIHYQYIKFKGKKLYVIKVEKSDPEISVLGKIYKRIGSQIKHTNPSEIKFKPSGYEKIIVINEQLENYKSKTTVAKMDLIEHYQSVLRIIDDLENILYPIDASKPTSSQEGKILTRILFSSFVDTFETYLSDLIYEISVAFPSTLKSKESVTIEEVLNCSDLQEFVQYYAKQKISKLQKGSVKGFIKEATQINSLGVINETTQNTIEKYLQIRHLYSHRNGIIDEKFIQYFSDEFEIKSEHQLSISEFCDILADLARISNEVDLEAISKYKLA